MNNKADTETLVSYTHRRLTSNIALESNLTMIRDSSEDDTYDILSELCKDLTSNPGTASVEIAHPLAVYALLLGQIRNRPKDISIKNTISPIINVVMPIILMENIHHENVLNHLYSGGAYNDRT